MTAAIGGAVAFVGYLLSLLTALGNKQYAFGISMLILFPISVVYCAFNWDKASHPGKLLIGGLSTMILSVCTIYLALP